MSSPKTKRIVIDGNIGSGKSTQLKMISGYTVNCEPIHDWPLKLFYDNPDRWAFLLQMAILKSFSDYEKSTVVIWERSPESSREVFWNILQKTKEEDDVYSYFYNQCGWVPDIHIYIRTDPKTCFERIHSRHQEGDTNISFEYVQKVHNSYERYIKSKGDSVIIVDGNKTPEEIHSEIVRCLRDVQV
jgi:deoxyadenosine/deoxycytidine kinase